MFNVFIFPPPPGPLRRQLNIAYNFQGGVTQDDPDSYQGVERDNRMIAIIHQHPDTGYALGYQEEFAQRAAAAEAAAAALIIR